MAEKRRETSSDGISFDDLCDIVEAQTGMPRDKVRLVGRRMFWIFMLCFLHKLRIYIRQRFAMDYIYHKQFVRYDKGVYRYYPGKVLVNFYLLCLGKRFHPEGSSSKRFRNTSGITLKQIARKRYARFRVNGPIAVDIKEVR